MIESFFHWNNVPGEWCCPNFHREERGELQNLQKQNQRRRNSISWALDAGIALGMISEFYYIAPLFILIVMADIVLSGIEGKDLYNSADTAVNFIIAVLGMFIDLVTKGIAFFILVYFSGFSFSWDMHPVLYWTGLFLIQDLILYLLHCSEHKIRLLWASHFIHHSSERFNFSTAMRVSVFQPFYRFIFYIPVVLSGFEAIDLMVVHSLGKIYVFFLHTERVGKLGVLELFLNTPSHHRVHHACNPQYLDRNMGNVLIIWDRIFGTFAEESEPVKYGTCKKPDSKNALSHLTYEWRRMFKDLFGKKTVKERIGSIIRMD